MGEKGGRGEPGDGTREEGVDEGVELKQVRSLPMSLGSPFLLQDEHVMTEFSAR